MKPVYFPVICATVTHPNLGTVTKLGIRKGVHEYTTFGWSYEWSNSGYKAFSFSLAFLHTSEIQSSKFSFQSSLPTSNFLHLLFSISYSPIWKVTFSLLFISKCHFSGLLFKRLLSNHWNKAVEASSNDLIRSSILSAITYGVLCGIMGY